MLLCNFCVVLYDLLSTITLKYIHTFSPLPILLLLLNLYSYLNGTRVVINLSDFSQFHQNLKKSNTLTPIYIYKWIEGCWFYKIVKFHVNSCINKDKRTINTETLL